MNASTRYVWQLLGAQEGTPAVATDPDSPYYHYARVEVLGMIKMPPRVVLEVGCGGGATGAEIKKRYPDAQVHGIELSAGAAEIARTRLDRVLNENVEQLDFAQAGFAPESIDLVLFPDVLEHLYDPWRVLTRLKPFLSRDAHVLSSIPNVRNLWLINELMGGKWTYEPAGLLDITHIRFFTRESICRMFDETGYRVESLGVNFDHRIPAVQAPQGQERFDVTTERVVLRQITAEDLMELRAVQFLVDASPVSA